MPRRGTQPGGGLDAATAAVEFATWLRTHEADKQELPEDVDELARGLADSWCISHIDAVYATCSPHRVALCVQHMRGFYLDEFADQLVALLPEWIRFLAERDATAPELADRCLHYAHGEPHPQITRDENGPDYTWSAEVLKPDVQLDPTQLLNLIGVGGNSKPGSAQSGSGLGGAASALASAMGGAQGALQGLQGGAAAMLAGPLGGVLSTQATTFIETLKKSVREIRLTVSWPDGKQRRTVSASQIVVILPESVGQTQTTPAPQPG